MPSHARTDEWTGLISLDAVHEAAARLADICLPTPVWPSRILSRMAGGSTLLKCENLQRTGSFKIRGAYNRIARLSGEQRARGVVAASAGNHAQGVALAAALLGVRSTVFMPAGAPLPKVEATKKYGADVVLHGAVYDESHEQALAFAEEHGAVLVHPFDHPDVIAGQATVALEILEQTPDVRTIVVPIGGGGLISGIAAAAKALRPDIRIVGAEPAGAATLRRCLDEGRVVTLPEVSTIADGLAAKRGGDLTFEYVRRLVDDVVLVTEEEIAQALLLMTERARLLLEPAAAVGVAAAMTQRSTLTFPAVVVASGGNIDPMLLLRVIRFGMTAAGRYFAFRTKLHDRPGELERLAAAVAGVGVNVVGIEHRREGILHSVLGDVEVTIQVELRGPEHVEQLTARLHEAGYEVDPL
ncbi:MAG TPA: threonine ammonia-lyase [Actinomycetota bacterium]|nr:threonine ammonia-lyase [Actinomycetota bacterium]